MRLNAAIFSIRSLALALALGSGSGAAWASSVSSFDFDFSSHVTTTIAQPVGDPVGYAAGSDLFSSIVFTDPDSDFQVDVTAGVVLPVGFRGSDVETIEDSRVGQYYGGLGASHIYNDGQHTVDEYFRDFLTLSFDQEVWLQTLDFDYFSPRYYADIQVYEGGIDGTLLHTDRIPFPGGIVDLPGEGLRGDTFVIAPATDGGKTDQFKLRAVTGHVVVPTPSAAIGGVVMLGLMGGGFGRRRRSD